jgi:hypothetical protein
MSVEVGFERGKTCPREIDHPRHAIRVSRRRRFHQQQEWFARRPKKQSKTEDQQYVRRKIPLPQLAHIHYTNRNETAN